MSDSTYNNSGVGSFASLTAVHTVQKASGTFRLGS